MGWLFIVAFRATFLPLPSILSPPQWSAHLLLSSFFFEIGCQMQLIVHPMKKFQQFLEARERRKHLGFVTKEAYIYLLMKSVVVRIKKKTITSGVELPSACSCTCAHRLSKRNNSTVCFCVSPNQRVLWEETSYPAPLSILWALWKQHKSSHCPPHEGYWTTILMEFVVGESDSQMVKLPEMLFFFF